MDYNAVDLCRSHISNHLYIICFILCHFSSLLLLFLLVDKEVGLHFWNGEGATSRFYVLIKFTYPIFVRITIRKIKIFILLGMKEIDIIPYKPKRLYIKCLYYIIICNV